MPGEFLRNLNKSNSSDKGSPSNVTHNSSTSSFVTPTPLWDKAAEGPLSKENNDFGNS